MCTFRVRWPLQVADMTTRRSGAGVGVIDGLLYAVGGHDGPTGSFDPISNF